MPDSAAPETIGVSPGRTEGLAPRRTVDQAPAAMAGTRFGVARGRGPRGSGPLPVPGKCGQLAPGLRMGG
jgi:hypothetical protein